MYLKMDHLKVRDSGALRTSRPRLKSRKLAAVGSQLADASFFGWNPGPVWMICLFVLFVYLCFCFYLFIYFRAEATSVGLCMGDQHETNNFGAIQGWCLFRLASGAIFRPSTT